MPVSLDHPDRFALRHIGPDDAETDAMLRVVGAKSLDDLMPEAFAVVKNACRRLCGQDVIVRGHPIRWEMVPFDVQLIGGYSLHTGHISTSRVLSRWSAATASSSFASVGRKRGWVVARVRSAVSSSTMRTMAV